MDLAVHHDFVRRARAFLDDHAERRAERSGAFVWGEGDDAIRVMGPADPTREAESMAEAASWRAQAFDAGLAWAGGPAEYGGGGLDPELNDVYRMIETEYVVPDQSMFGPAWDMIGPAVLAHGSHQLRQRFLAPIYRGDLLCSQLLSEPEAGSDLAGLRTRAVRDGDEWVVNGQKVWSSYAHRAKIGQLMARTDPDAPKHRGLTMFLLPLDSPGVEVRPLRQMTGDAEFNEIFLTDVRVPDANRVGDAGDGWRAVLTTLMSERTSVGTGKASSHLDAVQMITELARHLGRQHEPIVRQRLADVHIHDFLTRQVAARAADVREQTGAEPGAEGSILKLLGSRQNGRIGDLAGELLGAVVRRRRGRMGYLQLVEVPLRRTGPAHRRRDRRDPTQHPRRAHPGSAARVIARRFDVKFSTPRRQTRGRDCTDCSPACHRPARGCARARPVVGRDGSVRHPDLRRPRRRRRVRRGRRWRHQPGDGCRARGRHVGRVAEPPAQQAQRLPRSEAPRRASRLPPTGGDVRRGGHQPATRSPAATRVSRTPTSSRCDPTW